MLYFCHIFPPLYLGLYPCLVSAKPYVVMPLAYLQNLTFAIKADIVSRRMYIFR